MQRLIQNKHLHRFIFTALIFWLSTQLVTHTIFGPIDFDEGYNMQAPQQLIQTGQYASHDGVHDQKITTGATLLLPAAAFLAIFDHPLAPRIATVLFSLLLFYLLMRHIYQNIYERLFGIILLGAVPLFYFFATTLLGEIPGLTLVLLAYILYEKGKLRWSIFVLALAALTKTTYIFALIPLLMYPILVHAIGTDIATKPTSKWAEIIDHISDWFMEHFVEPETKPAKIETVKYLLGFASIYSIPFIAWELYRFSSFDGNTSAYLQNINNALDWGRSQGHMRPDLITQRYEMFVQVLGVGPLLIVLLTSIWVFLTIHFRNKVSIATGMLAQFALIWIMYHLLFGATAWYRHLFPGIVALVATVPIVFRILPKPNRTQLITISLIAILPLLIFLSRIIFQDSNDRFAYLVKRQNLLFLDQSNRPYLRSKQILNDQYEVAKFIRTNIKNSERIAGLGWYNAPQISYLTGRNIERKIGEETNYVIIDLWARNLNEGGVEVFMKRSPTLIFQNATYEIYKVEKQFQK